MPDHHDNHEYEAEMDADIAILGMSGRFPGAANINTFWENLCLGRRSIQSFTDEELKANGATDEQLADPRFVKAKPILADIDLFDAGFFGISAAEARVMAPHHRLFLECCWEALETAGYIPDKYRGSIGIFAGTNMNSYLLNYILPNPHILKELIGAQYVPGLDQEYMPTGVAYKLNLKGPALNLQTYCSTSLVAVHMAIQSLLNYESDIVLAGGASVKVPQIAGYQYQENGILSPDGQCRAFDESANGTVFGNGLGVVVLKRLVEALHDRDHIVAVVKGSAINNDGSGKVSFTAPSLDGQAAAISEALSNAAVAAESISYIETHGTGTNIGDPIEIAAIEKAFGIQHNANFHCYLGSVKPNIGHLEPAAGIASFIKTALALHHKKIPPSPNFNQLNSKIALRHDGFEVNRALRDWPDQAGPCRAGVSSFGIGGTNAHVVMEEAPPPPERHRQPEQTTIASELFILSAKSLSALDQICKNLLAFLKDQVGLAPLIQHPLLRDIAHTLQVGRADFNFRRCFVCSTLTEAIEILEQDLDHPLQTVEQSYRDPSIVFLFPDVTLTAYDHRHNCQTLYQQHAVFREAIARCEFVVREQLNLELSDLLIYRQTNQNYLQPLPLEQSRLALFCLEYALVQLWMSAGIKPTWLVGKGMGEYVAACVAHGMGLQEAVTIIWMSRHLTDPEDTDGVNAFETCVRNISYTPPDLPMISSLYGRELNGNESMDAAYWLAQAEHPELFSQGLQRIEQHENTLFIEMGPGHELSTIAAHTLTNMDRGAFIRSLPDDSQTVSDHQHFMQVLGSCWLRGQPIDWDRFYDEQDRYRVPIPTYPFERKRYWVDPPQVEASNPPSRTTVASNKSHPGDSPIYFPTWRWQPHPQSALFSQQQSADPSSPKNDLWLIWGANHQLVPMLIEALKHQDIHPMPIGERASTPSAWTLDESQRDQYINELHQLLDHTPAKEVNIIFQAVHSGNAIQDYYALLYLATALGRDTQARRFNISVLSNRSCPVLGEESLIPAKSLLWSGVKVIPKEYANISCQYYDLDLDTDIEAERAHEPWNQVAHDIKTRNKNVATAYRNGKRWVYELAVLPPVKARHRSNGSLFKQNGLYLITGGFTNIGYSVAYELASNNHVALIILDDLKTLEAYDDYPAKLASLKDVCPELALIQYDATDDRYLQAIVEVLKNWGGLDGIIHGFGHKGGRLIEHQLDSDPSNVLRPLLSLTNNLLTIMEQYPCNFFIGFSSLFAHYGRFAQVDYAAYANYLEALACSMPSHMVQRGLCIHWDAFKTRSSWPQAWWDEESVDGLGEINVLSIIESLLASELNIALISQRDLLQYHESEQYFRHATEYEAFTKDNTSARNLSSKYVKPTSALETKLAHIWQTFLGIDQVGIKDDYIDLGGDSLLAVRMMAAIESELGVKLPLSTLYHGSTIESFIPFVLKELEGGVDTHAEPK